MSVIEVGLAGWSEDGEDVGKGTMGEVDVDECDGTSWGIW